MVNSQWLNGKKNNKNPMLPPLWGGLGWGKKKIF